MAGHEIATHKRLATGIGGAVGLGALAVGLAGCSQQPPKDGATFASDTFGPWDKDGDGAVSLDEATQHNERYYTRSSNQRDFDWIQVTTNSYRDTYDSSIAKIVRAAGGSDAIASWKEIGDFAVRRYDQANDGVKDGLLDRGEQRDFRNEYGAEKLNERTELLSTNTELIYSPRSRNDYPGSGGYDPGPVYDDTDDDSDYDPGPVYSAS